MRSFHRLHTSHMGFMNKTALIVQSPVSTELSTFLFLSVLMYGEQPLLKICIWDRNKII